MISKKSLDYIQIGKCRCCHKIDPDPAGFKEAVITAVKVRNKLDGKWRIRVHHNIQWYWSLIGVNGHLSLHYSFGKYWTLFSCVPYAGGSDLFCSTFTNSPKTAVRRQLKHCVAVLTARVKNDSDILQSIGTALKKVHKTQ